MSVQTVVRQVRLLHLLLWTCTIRIPRLPFTTYCVQFSKETLLPMYVDGNALFSPRSRHTRPPDKRHTTAQQHAQSWRSDDSSPWMSHHLSGSWQDAHSTLGLVRREAVGGSSRAHSTRDESRQHHKVCQQETLTFTSERSPHFCIFTIWPSLSTFHKLPRVTYH